MTKAIDNVTLVTSADVAAQILNGSGTMPSINSMAQNANENKFLYATADLLSLLDSFSSFVGGNLTGKYPVADFTQVGVAIDKIYNHISNGEPIPDKLLYETASSIAGIVSSVPTPATKLLGTAASVSLAYYATFVSSEKSTFYDKLVSDIDTNYKGKLNGGEGNLHVIASQGAY